MRTIIPILIIALTFSCSLKNESANTIAEDGKSNSSIATQLTNSNHINQLSDRNTKLIKTANYFFKVSNIKKCTETIEQTLIKYPAFISSSNLDFVDNRMQNEMTIRVQNEYFDDVLKEIDREPSFVHYRNVSTVDASKEFVDLESRLKTKREVEIRYTEILRNKAGTIEELLNAEKQIGALHEEIEATISRINFLKDQVSYSTIHLKFYQELNQQVSEEETLSAQFIGAFTSGLNGLIITGLLLTNLWPAVLLIIVALVVWRLKSKVNLKPESA